MKNHLKFTRWLAFMLLFIAGTGAMAQPYPNSGDHTVCLNSNEPYGVVATPGSTYAWSIIAGTGGNGIINLGASPFDLITVTWNSVGTCTLRVIETNAAGCDGLPVDIIITVNPVPNVDPIANQVVCAGELTAAVSFTGAVPGTVFNWTNDTPGIGLAATGSGNIAAFTAVNLTNAPIVATITVTPSYTNAGATCTGTPETFTITVNPAPTVDAVADQVVCNAAPTTAITFTGNIPVGVDYNWTNDTPGIGLAATGTGNIASFNAINLTNAPIVATIVVTPSYTNGGETCPGVPETFTITVNPTPDVVAVADQVVCAGELTDAISFTGAVPGTVFNWTNDTPGIGLAATGTGNIAAFTAVNLTNAPIVATIIVTPSYTNDGVTCTGTPETFTITVNPAPSVDPVADQVVCNAAPTTAITFTGNIAVGVDYNWTNDTPGIGLAASGTGNIASFNAVNLTNAPIVATIVVTPSYTNGGETCPGVPETFTITVNPTPTVVAVADQVVCAGELTDAISFTGAVPGTVFNWTNDTPGIGLAATGTGNIAAFTAVNLTNAPIVATIIVTPSYTNDGVTCTGTPETFTITVNPAPSVDPVADQVVCNAAPTTAITFTGNIAVGVDYNWTNDTPGIGLAATGTGNIASFNAINLTNAPIVATIVVTPSYTNGGETCPGVPETFTITVNPTPDVVAVADQVVCAGELTDAISFTGAVPGTVFNWTNDTPGIGLAATGTGNIAAFTAVNLTNAPIVATIIVTPSYTNDGVTCTGTPETFTITVNPAPSVDPVADQVVCNAAPTTAITFTGNIAVGVDYNWTNDTPGIGLAASGTGNIASFNAVNLTNAPIVATIVVTPSYTNGGETCPGVPETFTITVNPTPTVVDPVDQIVCNGEATDPVVFTGAVAGTVYGWTNDTPGIGLAAVGSGDIASFNAVNLTALPIVATITVTPSYTNDGVTCTGTPQSFTITVNPQPLPTITQSPAGDICFGTAGVVYTTEAGMTNYSWNVVGGTITAGGTATDNTVTVTWDGAGPYSVSVSYTNTNGCPAPAPTIFVPVITPLPVTSPIYHN
jgi:hypothetical protein